MDSGHMDELESKDFWKLIAGAMLGSGVYRRTFECSLDPTLVIKVEQNEGCFANVREWQHWQDWQHCLSVADWLAPCVNISPNGKFLLQRKTTPLKMDKLPAKLPAFLTDRKTANYGYLGKRLVCHDYAGLIVTVKENLTKARWTDA